MGNTASRCEEAVAPDPRSKVPSSEVAVDEAAQEATVDTISGDEKPILPTPGALGDEPTIVDGQNPADLEAAAEEELAEAGADAAAEEEGQGKATITLSTAPIDPRFNIANASRYCYVSYNEAYRCYKDRGEDSPECAHYAKTYRSICPSEWIAAWNEARENGTWWGNY